jgi:hypothetical protein
MHQIATHSYGLSFLSSRNLLVHISRVTLLPKLKSIDSLQNCTGLMHRVTVVTIQQFVEFQWHNNVTVLCVGVEYP